MSARSNEKLGKTTMLKKYKLHKYYRYISFRTIHLHINIYISSMSDANHVSANFANIFLNLKIITLLLTNQKIARQCDANNGAKWPYDLISHDKIVPITDALVVVPPQQSRRAKNKLLFVISYDFSRFLYVNW